MTVGYQAWTHFGAEGVLTTSELVVAANGAEARVVGTASGSGYQGAVFVPHQSGVQAHLPGDMASGEPVGLRGGHCQSKDQVGLWRGS